MSKDEQQKESDSKSSSNKPIRRSLPLLLLALVFGMGIVSATTFGELLGAASGKSADGRGFFVKSNSIRKVTKKIAEEDYSSNGASHSDRGSDECNDDSFRGLINRVSIVPPSNSDATEVACTVSLHNHNCTNAFAVGYESDEMEEGRAKEVADRLCDKLFQGMENEVHASIDLWANRRAGKYRQIHTLNFYRQPS